MFYVFARHDIHYGACHAMCDAAVVVAVAVGTLCLFAVVDDGCVGMCNPRCVALLHHTC